MDIYAPFTINYVSIFQTLRKRRDCRWFFESLMSRHVLRAGFRQRLLVFGVYPKILGGAEQGSVMNRSQIIRDCTEIVSEVTGRKAIQDSVRRRNCPILTAIENVKVLPLGHNVLVFRGIGGWTRYKPFRDRQKEVDIVLQS